MRSTALKDAMRDNCLEELINACIQLTSSLHTSNPDLAASVLEAVARYVNWIDIRFVANDRYFVAWKRFSSAACKYCKVSLRENPVSGFTL